MKIESKHKRLVQNEKGPKVFLANVCSNYKKQHDFSYRNIFLHVLCFLVHGFQSLSHPLSRWAGSVHSGHLAEPPLLRSLYLEECGFMLRVLLISQLPTLSRRVTPWTLHKGFVYVACTWYSTLSVITQDSWP